MGLSEILEVGLLSKFVPIRIVDLLSKISTMAKPKQQHCLKSALSPNLWLKDIKNQENSIALTRVEIGQAVHWGPLV